MPYACIVTNTTQITKNSNTVILPVFVTVITVDKPLNFSPNAVNPFFELTIFLYFLNFSSCFQYYNPAYYGYQTKVIICFSFVFFYRKIPLLIIFKNYYSHCGLVSRQKYEFMI